MRNCKNCYHYHMCDLQNRLEDYQDCKYFKDKSLIIELPCKVGDTVFVIEKYVPDPSEKPRIIEAQISHIKHRQFVAYGIDENNLGEWCFSRKHIGKSVFYSREEAEKALRGRENNE